MQKNYRTDGFLLRAFFAAILCLTATFQAKGQEMPPRPFTVTVNMSQNLSFGAFCHGSAGGSVIVYSDGSRSATGDVVLLFLGYNFSTALFDVEANAGTIISIQNGSDATLTGSNGGSMTLKIGDANLTSPFVIAVNPPEVTQVMIGGTLIVGNSISNPPGNYSGTFDVIFNQE